MARFMTMPGTNGAYRFWDWDNYSEVGIDENGATLRFDPSSDFAGRPIDSDVEPYRIRINFADATIVPGGDDDPDGINFSSGTITSITFFNEAGERMLVILDIDVPLQALNAFANIDGDIGRWIRDFIGSQDNTHYGANASDDDADESNIRTGAGDDTIFGRAGRDFIEDRGGSDSYNGGSGFDVLSYEGTIWDPRLGTSGITADMVAGTVIGPDGNTDTIRLIEQIYGTNYDDSFIGDGQNNRFRGYAGDDFMNGRGGFDTADYSRDLDRGGFQGIDANLASGTVRDAFGSTDTLVSIEAIRGTDMRDVIRDNGRDNQLRGEGGNDTLRISRGDDDVRGGEGADRFIFVTGNFGNNYIDDFNEAEGDTIMINNATSIDDLTITQVNEGGNFGVYIETAWGEIYLNGVDRNTLTDDAFIF